PCRSGGGAQGRAGVAGGAARPPPEAPPPPPPRPAPPHQTHPSPADPRHSGERISVHHAPEFVGMHEKPSEALGRTPNASILVATQLVAEGEADAVVSAGDTRAGGVGCAPTLPPLPGRAPARPGRVPPPR